jgi:hypothetical protein
VLLNLEIAFRAESGFDFSNFFEYKNSKYPGLVHVNFVSIMKRVGQNNMIICLVGHHRDFDQSQASMSTQDMRTSPYEETLSDKTRRRSNIVSTSESLFFVYAQKGNSTEVKI